MGHERLGWSLRRLREALAPTGAADADASLLNRFLQTHDEQAFTSLVERHGRLVLGVCRRILRDSHLAEDAFQATFLVLARRAGSLRQPALLANWLYGVAYRTALQARRALVTRQMKEQQAAARAEAVCEPREPASDLQALLDEELSRLPDRYRCPVVLCDLEGLTRKEAARRLGWQEGTLSGRLFRARALLAKRLSARGLVVSGGALAGMVSQASAAPPVSLVVCTAKAAAGELAAASAGALALAQGMMKAMLLTKLKGMATGLVVVCLTVGGGTAGYRALATEAGQQGKADKARDAGAVREAELRARLEQLTAENEKLKQDLDVLRRVVEERRAEELRQRERAEAERARAEAERAKYDQGARTLADAQRAELLVVQRNQLQAQAQALRAQLAKVEADLARLAPNAARVQNQPGASNRLPPPPAAKVAPRLTLTTYLVGDLVDDPAGQQLIQVIVETVAPETWSKAGGPGSIAYLGKTRMLIVRQTREVQDEVAVLLERLKEAAKR